VAHRDGLEWLVRTIAAAGTISDVRDPELKAARAACIAPKPPPPVVWPEIAEACATLQTTFGQDDEEGIPDGDAPDEVF
jgi:hypothetical protein